MVSNAQDGPLYVIVEYAEHGNLRDFLRKFHNSQGCEHRMSAKVTPPPSLPPSPCHANQAYTPKFAFENPTLLRRTSNHRMCQRYAGAADVRGVRGAEFGDAHGVPQIPPLLRQTGERQTERQKAEEFWVGNCMCQEGEEFDSVGGKEHLGFSSFTRVYKYLRVLSSMTCEGKGVCNAP